MSKSVSASFLFANGIYIPQRNLFIPASEAAAAAAKDCANEFDTSNVSNDVWSKEIRFDPMWTEMEPADVQVAGLDQIIETQQWSSERIKEFWCRVGDILETPHNFDAPVIMCLSGRGATGKSTLSAAIALLQQGSKCSRLECMEADRATEWFSIENAVKKRAHCIITCSVLPADFAQDGHAESKVEHFVFENTPRVSDETLWSQAKQSLPQMLLKASLHRFQKENEPNSEPDSERARMPKHHAPIQ